MDELAQRYLLLVLRLARHRPDLIASYIGPAELREAIDGEGRTLLVELHDEAMTLGELVAEAFPTARTRWLHAQLRALAAVARTLAGEEIAYLDLVDELYDVRLSPEPEDTFRAAHAMLDGGLPPGDSLRERLAAHAGRSAIPPMKAVEAVTSLAQLLRRRTKEDLWLPDGEGVDFVVEDGLGHTYLGNRRSRIAVPGDRPLMFDELVTAASRHAYPGRHVERATKEALLLGRRGWLEAAVACRYTPESLISSGIAAVGREVVLTDQELGVELTRTARAAGVRIDVGRELSLARAWEHLVPAVANAAIAMHHDGAPSREIRGYLAEVALVADAEVDGVISLLSDPLRGTTPVLAFAGLRLLREWLQIQGQTHGLARALAEPLTPGDLALTDA